MSALPTLFTLQDLTDHYGWSKDTLYDYIDQGLLPASKIGRSYVVTPEGVTALLAAKAVTRIDDDDDTTLTAPGASAGPSPKRPPGRRAPDPNDVDEADG